MDLPAECTTCGCPAPENEVHQCVDCGEQFCEDPECSKDDPESNYRICNNCFEKKKMTTDNTGQLLDYLVELEEDALETVESIKVDAERDARKSRVEEALAALREFVLTAEVPSAPDPAEEGWSLEAWKEDILEKAKYVNPHNNASYRRNFDTSFARLVAKIKSGLAKDEVMPLMNDLGGSKFIIEGAQRFKNLVPHDFVDALYEMAHSDKQESVEDRKMLMHVIVEAWGRTRKEEGMKGNGLSWERAHGAMQAMHECLQEHADKFAEVRQGVVDILPDLTSQIADEGVEDVLP